MRGAGEGGAVDAALSRRARVAVEAVRAGWGEPAHAAADHQRPAPLPHPAAPQPRPAAPEPRPSPELLASLRHHLLGGETHYPDRPGMADLRRRVGAALPGAGYPERGPDGVLITAGEGESLFVTLLGLGTPSEIRLSGPGARRHGNLLKWMGVRAVEPGSRDGDGATDPEIHLIGDRLFGAAGAGDPLEAPVSCSDPGSTRDAEARSNAHAASDDPIVIGSLDGLADMRLFRLGFVAAPPEGLANITKWKQASSICSPAPSQRAALRALGVRP